MRLIKMFGLAAIAVAAVMAFAGAGSAMATTELEEVVLCDEDAVNAGDQCPAGHDFPSGTVLHGELEAGTKAVLLSDLGNVECSTSTILGVTTSLLAHGEITALAFGGCKVGLVNCTVTVEHLNYLAKVLLNANKNGYHMVVTEKVGNGRPQARVTCGSVIDCTFGSPEALYIVELKPTHIVIRILQELERGSPGITCPSLASELHMKILIRGLNISSVLVGFWPKMEPLL